MQLSEAFGKLYGSSKQVPSNDTVELSKPRGGAHENCITYAPLSLSLICSIILRAIVSKTGWSTVPKTLLSYFGWPKLYDGMSVPYNNDCEYLM